jgi:hypothetical protein
VKVRVPCEVCGAFYVDMEVEQPRDEQGRFKPGPVAVEIPTGAVSDHAQSYEHRYLVEIRQAYRAGTSSA